MRIAGETVGARGAVLLAVTAVVGIVLASHGWSSKSGVPSAGAGFGAPAPSAPASPPPSQGPTTGPTTGPTAGPTTGPSKAPSSSPAPTPGPKLSSQSFASYAYQVWPGTPSSAAQAAETGLVISVTRQNAGILVSAGVVGQSAPKVQYYPTGVKVYVIEASMGDDSGESDYNLGDDGLVVTDAQGRILQ